MAVRNTRSEQPLAVLVVEDHPSENRLICIALQEAGYVAVAAHSAAEARDVLEQHVLSLILLDLHLPDTPGVSLLTELRHCTSIPIIVATGDYDTQVQEAVLQAGATDYVLKPFGPSLLIRRIDGALADADDHAVLVLDHRRLQLIVDGRGIQLSVPEYHLLSALSDSDRHACSHEELNGLIYPGEPCEPERLSQCVRDLRRRARRQGTDHPVAEAIPGFGFRLAAAVIQRGTPPLNVAS